MDNSQISQFYEWIKALAKKDSADFDLHGFCQGKNSILFQKKELKNYSYSSSRHINLRVLKGEKAGASWTKDFSKESLQDCYKRAMEGLKLSDKKERGELAQNKQYEDFCGFYDESFKEIPLQDKLKKAKNMNRACLGFDSKVQPVYSSVSDLDNYCFFINSKGFQSFYKSSDVSAGCYSLAVQGDSRSNGYSESYARNYESIDFKKIGSESAGKALKKLSYSIPQTKRYPVVFQAGQPVGSLLLCLADLMSGKSVFEGLSLFKNSLKKKIFSKELSLYDDPLALWGSQSRPFDGEGFSTEKTALVEKGVLQNYLTSSFFAKALKAPHTKKACWNNEKGELDISASNLLMAEGNSSFEEMTGEFPQVIVIDVLKGFAGYNAISGDFSLESEGFLQEGGEARPLCQFTVSGNIRDLFLNILKIGRDSCISAGAVKAPSFLAPELMIAGK